MGNQGVAELGDSSSGSPMRMRPRCPLRPGIFSDFGFVSPEVTSLLRTEGRKITHLRASRLVSQREGGVKALTSQFQEEGE